MAKSKKIIGLLVVVIVVTAGWYVDHGMHMMGFSFSASPSASSQPSVELKNYGPAPEFTGISQWLNSEPLTLAALKGKVVLVDFWTYSCINCIRTLPYVTKWYDTYKDQGLVVVGVHTPEFAFEKDTHNVSQAIDRFNIKYPVAQDNEYATWTAYSNQYWPAEYLIDQNGNVVHVHFGEGDYEVTENAIRQLLGMNTQAKAVGEADLSQVQSPEMYFGTARLKNLAAAQSPSSVAKTYTLPTSLELNTFGLQGTWQFTENAARLTKGSGTVRLKFHSGKIYAVAASATPITIQIIVDGVAQPSITIGASQLYTLFDSNQYIDHVVDIVIPAAGLEMYTFTFG